MAENWQIGDDALCVSRDDWIFVRTGDDASGPRAGQCYKVTALGFSGPHGLFLGFAEFPRQGYHHSGFIKVTPSPELIAEERRERMPV